MDVKINGSQVSVKGSEGWFTGIVRIELIRFSIDPTRPGKWHQRHIRAGRTHRLAYTSAGAKPHCHRGVRLGEKEGEAVQEISPGDVVWFAPGEKHWHGASAKTAMTHIAI